MLKILKRRKSKELDSEPLVPVTINAIDGVLSELYEELGLGVYTPTKGVPDAVLGHLGAIKVGVRRYKSGYVTTRVMELVAEGKKVPKWLQALMDKEIEISGYTGEPEDITP